MIVTGFASTTSRHRRRLREWSFFPCNDLSRDTQVKKRHRPHSPVPAGRPVLRRLPGQAIASRRTGQVTGLAVVCTADPQTVAEEVPEPVVLRTAGDQDPEAVLGPAQAAEYRDYLVVRTAVTLRRCQQAVVPAVDLVDQAGLGQVLQRWPLRPRPEQRPLYPNPTLILARRPDARVSYAWPAGQRVQRRPTGYLGSVLLAIRDRSRLAWGGWRVAAGAGRPCRACPGPWHPRPAPVLAFDLAPGSCGSLARARTPSSRIQDRVGYPVVCGSRSSTGRFRISRRG
jgi:hypothetical protein